MTIRELKKDYPKLGALAESLMDAYADIDCSLDGAFDWGNTPQEHDFWMETSFKEGLDEKEDAVSRHPAFNEKTLSKKDNPKILILGSARHGKDTVAEMICNNTDLKFASSSKVAADIFLKDLLNEKYGKNYANSNEAFEDRVNCRSVWYDEICNYNSEDKLRLTKDILSVADIYVGLRNHKEVEQAIIEDSFDYIIGVYDYRKPVECTSSNTADLFKYSDFVITNNGTLEDLEKKVIKLILKII